jgi:hypothetical protein
MPALTATEFLRVFRLRRERCEQLLDLSRRQGELIAAQDYTSLLTVLGRKQRLLGELDELGRQNPEFWTSWRSQRAALDHTDRDDCDHVLAETEALLANLVVEEQRSAESLTLRRDTMREQLQSISTAARAHEAYRDNLAPATHRRLNIDR